MPESGSAPASATPVANAAGSKLKKDGTGTPPGLVLRENPDILRTIATRSEGRPGLVVGFAAETVGGEDELLADLDIKGIGGMTLGADPLISATTVISHEKGRPLAGLIVRKESKGHGTNQYVEGLSNFKPGDPVAMVEDVVTTGGSLLKACERVKDAGLNVVAVCTVLDRGEGGREAIEAAGYQLRALFTRPELVELAKED